MSFLDGIPAYLLIAACVGAVFMLGWYAKDRRAGLVLVVALLFASSAGLRPPSEGDTPIPTWVWPLQIHRTTLVFLLSTLLMVGTITHMGRMRWYFSGPAALLFLVGLYAGMLRIEHEGVVAGLGTVTLAVLMRVPMMGLMPNLLEDDEGIDRLVRALVWLMVVWCGVVFIQVFVNRAAMFGGAGQTDSFRFSGITSNPQAAAVFLAIMGGITLWATLNGGSRSHRLLAGAVTGATLIMLAWTGSRTGALMFLLIGGGVMYQRLGRTAILAPVLAVVTYGLWKFATSVLDIDLGLTRLSSTEDTRTAAWVRLWEVGTENPVFGVGTDDVGASENSILYAFASYGIGMLMLVLLMAAVTLVQMLKLWQVRRQLSPYRQQLANLVLGFNAAYFAGSVFEGYIIARISAMTVFWFIFAGIATKLLADCREQEAQTQFDIESSELALRYGEQSQ